MVPKLPADLPKDRQATMLASVKIDSTLASCPTGMDHRLASQPSGSIGDLPDEQSTLPELSYFNVDDFLNTIDRLNDNLNDSNGGLNGEQFMNLAEVSQSGPLRDTYLTSTQLQDARDIQCKVVLVSAEPSCGLEIEDVQQNEDLREIEMDRNNEQIEAAVPTADVETARRKRSFDLADPTLASMFYPGNACLEPLAKKVRIVESGSSAYLEWFSSTDTSVQHLAASDMLEVLKLPKDNAFASWVAFNTEKSTEKKEDSASNCADEISARLVGYDYEMSPRRNSESSDYDMYWMSNSDDYLSSAPPSGKLCSVSLGGVRTLGDLPNWELLKTLDVLSWMIASSSQSKNKASKSLSGELAEDCTGHLPLEKQIGSWCQARDEREENHVENIVQLTGELVECDDIGDLELPQLDLLEEVLGNWKVPPGELVEWNPEDFFLLPDELPEWNIQNWCQSLDKSCGRQKQMQQPSGELSGCTAEDWHQQLGKSCGGTKKMQKISGRPRGRPRKTQPSGRPRGRPKKKQEPWGKSHGKKPKNRQQPFEDEIDVVSVPTSGRSPAPVEDNLSSWDILPASTLMSEHVADLHSYSSRPVHRPPEPTRCPVTVGSVSAPPSPVTRVAPPPAKRCVSNPASPLQRIAARHRKRRGMQDGGRGRRVKIDKDCMKRAQHNVLERERRLQLTQQFTVLRVQVPSIRTNERASKSDILNGARTYILKLKHQRTELNDTYDKETRINAQLRKTLNEMIRLHKSKKGAM